MLWSYLVLPISLIEHYKWSPAQWEIKHLEQGRKTGEVSNNWESYNKTKTVTKCFPQLFHYKASAPEQDSKTGWSDIDLQRREGKGQEGKQFEDYSGI
jgi:hypothetical protein